MDSRSFGVLLVVGGIAVVVIGVLVYSGALGWFGRLPGDIRVERGATRIYVPITSMILASIVLSVVLAVLRRLF